MSQLTTSIEQAEQRLAELRAFEGDYCESTRRAPSGRTCANCGAYVMPKQDYLNQFKR